MSDPRNNDHDQRLAESLPDLHYTPGYWSGPRDPYVPVSLELLRALAPPFPILNDLGGCRQCGGYGVPDFDHHLPDCAWVAARQRIDRARL